VFRISKTFSQEYTNFLVPVRIPRTRLERAFRPSSGMALRFLPKIPITATDHEGNSGTPFLAFFARSGAFPESYFRTACATGSRRPASLASFAALSVASHVKSESLRPKCPYAAVFL